ncbi:MAG: ribonuclease P protein subunit [Candidatus Aenigmarchaeota archaeon]|nr:ribonuclease P protein subunit [Candidatus Aenigmarchaeota archaeon]
MKLKDIRRHEFIGLKCQVMSAKNRDQINIKGSVADETMNNIMLLVSDKKKVIPKKGTVFRLWVGNKKIDLEGDYIIGRPEDRIKKKFKKW